MPDDARFCTYCGTAFQQETWPRTCGGCGKTTYRNPIPVIVALVPVTDRRGLLVIRRAVRGDPGHGRLALPGGFLDYNDASWQAAAAREVWEETGVRLPAEGFREFAVRSAPDHTLLVFAVGPGVTSVEVATFKTSNETSEMAVIEGPRELAFPLHTEVAERYFREVTEAGA